MRPFTWVPAGCALLAVAMAWAEGPTSRPDDQTPALGTIRGTIAPADAVKSVSCIDREFNLPYPAKWDAETGRLTVENLPTGRRYDLEVATKDGRTFKGVDLSYEEDELIRLARETAKEKEEPPGPLTEKDRAEIGEIVTKVETFENERKILHLQGNHDRATALVDLRRTSAFHSGKAGEQIRRVELWYFKFQYGGWEKVANAEKVLLRQRASARQIEQTARQVVYVPQLGGILVQPGPSGEPLNLQLPGYAKPPTTQPQDNSTQPAGTTP